MNDDTLTVRIEHDWKEKLEKLASKEKKTKSDLVRELLKDYIRNEEEKEKLKATVAKKYASGDISFDELIRVLGYEEARRVAFYVHTAEESLREGLSGSEDDDL